MQERLARTWENRLHSCIRRQLYDDGSENMEVMVPPPAPCVPKNLPPNVKSFALYMYNTIRAGCALVHQNKPVCTAVSAGKPTVQRPVTDPPLVVRLSFGVVHSCSCGARVRFPELFQIEVSPWQRNQLTPIVWHSPGISQNCFGNEVAKLLKRTEMIDIKIKCLLN